MKFPVCFHAPLLLAACLLPFCASTLHAQATPSDELVFTNGDHLAGKLERAVGGNVVFKSDMAGELTVPFAKIKQLRSNGRFVVLEAGEPLAAMRTAHPGKLDFDGGSITVEQGAGAAQVVPAAKAAYVIDEATYTKQIAQKAKFYEGWSGTATAGATLVRSTTYGQTFTAALNLSRDIPSVPYLPKRNRTILDAAESYGQQTTPVIPPTNPVTPAATVKTNILHADAERDEYLNKKLYVLGTATFDHNYAQGLNLQQIYGVGVGATVLQDARQQLDLHLDAHYERQAFFTPASDMNLIGATIAETYKRTLPAKIVFNETANYIPAFNSSSAYAANVTAGITLPAYKRLSASFNTVDNYLNDPAPFYQKNSFQFIAGLSYSVH